MTSENGSKKIHLVGVGGVGMGTLATALKRAGHDVSGSDKALYEPMKSVLEQSGVQAISGYHAETVKTIQPDQVVIGNVVRNDNEEVRAWLGSGVKFMSFPEAVRRLVISDRHSIVVAGTHGKTTTTSWVSFLLKQLGYDPSYLIGGVPQDLPYGCDITSGTIFVGEGDEYDSAFFDKGPKFLHYNPQTLILTGIEFDHADIYRDLAHVKESFEKLIALLPGDGLCVARYDDPVVMELISDSLCPVQTFGLSPRAMWRVGKVLEDTQGLKFEVLYKGRSAGVFETPLFGDHNLMNLISGIVVAINLGSPMEKIRDVVKEFNGVKRRQEYLLREPVIVIDDFAHHPTEVKATLLGIKRRYPDRKVWAIFEPRSSTARKAVHQKEYPPAFQPADRVIMASVFNRQDVNEPLSEAAVIEAIAATGKKAELFTDTDAIIQSVIKEHQAGDVIVIMSNGGFDNLQAKLMSALK